MSTTSLSIRGIERTVLYNKGYVIGIYNIKKCILKDFLLSLKYCKALQSVVYLSQGAFVTLAINLI